MATTDDDRSIEPLSYPREMDHDADGFGDLTAFQRDVIVATLRMGGYPESDDPPYGLGLRQELFRTYGVEVNHGRLYPNLDQLVDRGLLTKSAIDKRTNGYRVTPQAIDALRGYVSFLQDADDCLPDDTDDVF